MEYKSWTFRNRRLLVEKYVGVVSNEEIIKNDDALYADIELHNQPLLGLTDLSQATFPDLQYDQIAELFTSLDKHFEKTQGMKIAIYTGSNLFEDFQKVMAYSKTGQSRFSIIPFNILASATRWLGLTQEEEKEVTKLLSDF